MVKCKKASVWRSRFFMSIYIGMMSGTSLDGVDAVAVLVRDRTRFLKFLVLSHLAYRKSCKNSCYLFVLLDPMKSIAAKLQAIGWHESTLRLVVLS